MAHSIAKRLTRTPASEKVAYRRVIVRFGAAFSNAVFAPPSAQPAANAAPNLSPPPALGGLTAAPSAPLGGLPKPVPSDVVMQCRLTGLSA